ncbi:hypothetical protein [Deefgea piscis]|uniref:hypothetical protein n=1 Tax=Deefgea piscis TaxID=2739061 RepID=UPI001C7E4A23|nr:hypothetical protein [Deefgea piscis]QZA80274.1 hypothetical protein K4H25_12100 [Deefgea piscis]
MEIIKRAEALATDLSSGQGTASIYDARSMICQLIDELKKQAEINIELKASVTTATAAGRAEAVSIIMALPADEAPLEDCVESLGQGYDGEYSYRWNKDKLLAMFFADGDHLRLLDKMEAIADEFYYENLENKQRVVELEIQLTSLKSTQTV